MTALTKVKRAWCASCRQSKKPTKAAAKSGIQMQSVPDPMLENQPILFSGASLQWAKLLEKCVVSKENG